MKGEGDSNPIVGALRMEVCSVCHARSVLGAVADVGDRGDQEREDPCPVGGDTSPGENQVKTSNFRG